MAGNIHLRITTQAKGSDGLHMDDIQELLTDAQLEYGVERNQVVHAQVDEDGRIQMMWIVQD